MAELPTGTVTFLFTDIEGSTKLAQQFPDALPALLARHHAILREAIEAHHGHVFQIIGDAFCAAFYTASDALQAALGAQRSLQHEAWNPAPIKVRMGLHTGAAQAGAIEDRAGGFIGYLTLTRVQRVMSTAHGGQVLLSNSTAELVRGELPDSVTLHDMGEHRLKGLVNLERLWQMAAPDLIADFPPLQSLNAIPTNLPNQLTSFIGRNKELVEVKQLIAAQRLITLVGPGGTGKSRLSLQVAAEVLPAFEHGAWLVQLAPLANPALILQAIAAIFELRELPNHPLANAVTDYLRAKSLLLVLDNCEHLVEACAQLADHLLHACPHLKIMVSSREALGIAGEAIYRVPSLSLPDPSKITLDAVAHCEAVQLFIERAIAVQQHFSLDEGNAATVAQICRRLDGIPLAIELAAARVKALKVEQIADRLDDRFRLLTGGSRTALPRQQTLRALIEWSYDLLSDQERSLFQRLAVFAGGWTLEAAEGVCAGDGLEAFDVLDLLTRLVDKSLVVMDDSANKVARYHFLETIRQFARDKLFESGEAVAVRDRHLAYFVRLSEEAEPALHSNQALIWRDRLDPEFENLRAALAWGLEQRPEDTLRLAGNLMFFWVQGTRAAEGLDWLRKSLDRVRALPSVEGATAQHRKQIIARGLAAAGLLTFSLGNWDESNSILAEAIPLAREAGDRMLLGIALAFQGTTLYQTGDMAAVRAVVEEAVALGRELGEVSLLPIGLVQLAGMARRENDAAAAERYTAEAQQLIQSGLGQNPTAPLAIYVMAMEARRSGDLASERRYLQQAAALAQHMSNRTVTVSVASELAHLARQTGDIQAAKVAYRQTIAKWQDLGIRSAVAHELECLAFVARAENQGERAARLLGAAEALRSAIGTPMRPYERLEYDHEVAALHQQLEDAAFKMAWAEGRAMTMEQAIELALSEV